MLDMNTISDLSEAQVSEFLDTLRYSERTISFLSKANRDRVAKAAKAEGLKVRVSSIRNQLLDLHYLADSGETDQGLANEKRWVNAVYRVSPDNR